MSRFVLTSVLALNLTLCFGQPKKFYTLKETERYDTVAFNLDATTGHCFLKSSDEGPLSIYGNPDLEKINPSFKSKVINGTCIVDLDLEEFRSSSLGDGLLFAVLNSEENQNNFWEIIFNHEKVYRLDLNYGFGNAHLDMSGLSVQNFKVKSGSADISVSYDDGLANQIEMDTFWVKTDMGTINAKNLELARAKYIKANVGFGRAMLDFSTNSDNKCTIDASVGAGNLEIFLPGSQVPTIINVKESPLCGLRLAHGFEEVEKNVFVNMSYQADAENLLVFNVDVALGSIMFRNPK